MPLHPNLSVFLFLAAFVVAAIGVYGTLINRIMARGGRVHTGVFELPDLLVTFVLTSFFALMVVRTVSEPAPAVTQAAPVSPEQVLPAAAFFLALLVMVGAFLWARKIPLAHSFGLTRVSLLKAGALALGLVLAAFPLVAAAAVLTRLAMPAGAQEQELVTLFRQVARHADHASIAKILVAGVIVAPLAEEFLFRGYFYAVLKRYLGPLASALLTAGLFAAFHVNLASLPGLFILALCLTIAYEASGSLLVPITMHAIFNSTQLAFLLVEAQRAAPGG